MNRDTEEDEDWIEEKHEREEDVCKFYSRGSHIAVRGNILCFPEAKLGKNAHMGAQNNIKGTLLLKFNLSVSNTYKWSIALV